MGFSAFSISGTSLNHMIIQESALIPERDLKRIGHSGRCWSSAEASEPHHSSSYHRGSCQLDLDRHGSKWHMWLRRHQILKQQCLSTVNCVLPKCTSGVNLGWMGTGSQVHPLCPGVAGINGTFRPSSMPWVSFPQENLFLYFGYLKFWAVSSFQWQKYNRCAAVNI